MCGACMWKPIRSSQLGTGLAHIVFIVSLQTYSIIRNVIVKMKTIMGKSYRSTVIVK